MLRSEIAGDFETRGQRRFHPAAYGEDFTLKPLT